MTTIEALLADLEADAPVRQVLVGAFWTAIHPAAGWLPPWLCLLEIPVKAGYRPRGGRGSGRDEPALVTVQGVVSQRI